MSAALDLTTAPMLTVAEACTVMRVSRSTLTELMERGVIGRSPKGMRPVRVSTADVLAYVTPSPAPQRPVPPMPVHPRSPRPRLRATPGGEMAPRTTRKRAQKGDGCIRYDTARGVWTGILDIGRDPETGKRRRRKVSHTDREECQALMDGLKAEKRQTGTVARRDVTVRQVVDEWLEHGVKRARSPITKTGHSDSAARICEGHGMLGGKRLVQLETTDVELAMARMAANGYSASSIKQSLSVPAPGHRSGYPGQEDNRQRGRPCRASRRVPQDK